jgi:hypothetical protein
LRLTVEKLRKPVLASGQVTEAVFDEAIAAFDDPSVTIVRPTTVAARGRRT